MPQGTPTSNCSQRWKWYFPWRCRNPLQRAHHQGHRKIWIIISGKFVSKSNLYYMVPKFFCNSSMADVPEPVLLVTCLSHGQGQWPWLQRHSSCCNVRRYEKLQWNWRYGFLQFNAILNLKFWIVGPGGHGSSGRTCTFQRFNGYLQFGWLFKLTRLKCRI